MRANASSATRPSLALALARISHPTITLTLTLNLTRCYTPVLPRTGHIDVQITLNAQNFQLHPLNVTSFAPVVVDSLSPTTGPQRSI